MRLAIFDFTVRVVCAGRMDGVFVPRSIVLMNDILIIKLCKFVMRKGVKPLSWRIHRLTLSVGFLLRGAKG